MPSDHRHAPPLPPAVSTRWRVPASVSGATGGLLDQRTSDAVAVDVLRAHRVAAGSLWWSRVLDRRSSGTAPDNARSQVGASANGSRCSSAGQLVGAFRGACFPPLDWSFLSATGLRSLAQPTGDELVEFIGVWHATRHVSNTVRSRRLLAGHADAGGQDWGKSSVEGRRAAVRG